MLPWGRPAAGADGRLIAYFCDPPVRPALAGVVAAGPECAAFRAWVDALSAQAGALRQLRCHGFTYDPEALGRELAQALAGGPPGAAARLVGQRLLALLAARRGAACFLLEEGT
jgi:hypothetical protein